MRRGSWVLASAALVAMSGMTGCEWLQRHGIKDGQKLPYNPDEAREVQAPQRDIQFDDIPVPRTFVLARHQIFSFQAASFRFGEYEYEGTWTFRRAAAFYQDQMPLSGWKLVEVTPVDEYRAVMVYDKGIERCSVDVASLPDAVRIRIKIDKIPENERADQNAR